jgi:hypothetical protein
MLTGQGTHIFDLTWLQIFLVDNHNLHQQDALGLNRDGHLHSSNLKAFQDKLHFYFILY